MMTKEEKKQLISRFQQEQNFSKDDKSSYYAFTGAMITMMQEGMITDLRGNQMNPLSFGFGDSFDMGRVGSFLIRASEDEDPYMVGLRSSANPEVGIGGWSGAKIKPEPVTQEAFLDAYGENLCGEPPKKPGRLRSAWDFIRRKIFRAGGDPVCEQYRAELANYKKDQYYALKDAGYSPEKPDSIRKAEREVAAKSYFAARDMQKTGNRIVDFRRDDDPEYKAFLEAPGIDAFVDSKETQAFLKSLREQGIRRVDELTELDGRIALETMTELHDTDGKNVVNDMLRAYENVSGKGNADTARKNREKAIRGLADDAMRRVNEAIDNLPENGDDGLTKEDCRKFAGQVKELVYSDGEDHLGRKARSVLLNLDADGIRAVMKASKELEQNGAENGFKALAGALNKPGDILGFVKKENVDMAALDNSHDKAMEDMHEALMKK